MKSLFLCGGLLVVSLMSASCGGGGTDANAISGSETTGGGSVATPIVEVALPPDGSREALSKIQPSNLQRYAGNYSSACEVFEEAVNLDLGGAVYVRSHTSVTPSLTNQGSFAFRLDFFADPGCQSAFLGALSNTNPDNRITIVGVSTPSGVPADKVVLSVFPPATPFVLGNLPETVVFGSSVRLALPLQLFQAWELKDLWRLEDGLLYYGGSDTAADGFPVSMDVTQGSPQAETAPAIPAQPCGARTLQWSSGRGTCTAQVGASLSSSRQWFWDSTGPTTGRADFICSNGFWSEPIDASCSDTTPIPPDCPSQTLTWTVNGNTCSGTVAASYVNQFVTVENRVPALMGAKQLRCARTENPSGAVWSELIFPELPNSQNEVCDVVVVLPPETDPLRILRNKNCLLCHAVSNGGAGFLSFETIAAYYRNNPPAPGLLENKIKSGGVGVFLNFPMPSNPQISDAELAIVVPWILSR